MLASKGPASIPGGWGKDVPSGTKPSTYDDVEESMSEQELATGIVSETGEVVNNAGQTVGKITEGEVDDLAGNVVTASGDIVGKTGDVLGKALPLDDATEKGPDGALKKGGWTVIGTVKSVTGAVGGTVGSTVGAVGNTVGGVVGGLGKGLGLGGKEVGDEEKEDELIKLDDKETDLPNGTDVAAPSVDEAEDDVGHTTDAVQDTAEDTVDTTKDTVDDTKDEVDDTAEDLPPVEDQAPLGGGDDEDPEDNEDGKSVVGTVAEDAESTAEKGAEDAKSTVSKVGDEVSKAGSKAGDEVSKAGDEVSKAGSKAGDEVSKAGSQIGSQVPQSELGEDFDPLAEPFKNFEGAIIGEDGKVFADDQTIGHVADGNPEDLIGKFVDPEGNILGDSGTVLGRASLKDELKEELIKQADFTLLKGAKVNKAGNLVNDKGEVVGHLTEGVLKNLIGKRCDEEGKIWNDAGKVVGRAEPIPEEEREEFREPAPFEDFPDATVQSNGEITSDGEVIGKLVEGDAKKLKGKKVDADGDVQDKSGNVIGRAERWDAPEAEAEPEKDRSILAGKRVNKLGNVVDSSGTIFGRLIEGDPKRLAGRMCDKEGNVRSESGDIIGRAEVVPEGEREGQKDGPFAELQGCTVTKEGKVVTPGGDVVGRLLSGDPKVLVGRAVDEDGDVLDRNGNSIGKAERWEEPAVEKKKGPMAGRRVNREGNVVDEDGNVIGRLTSGDLSIASGKEIDDDGDVVNSKGTTIGHVSLLADIPVEDEPEPEGESEEDRTKRELAASDKELAVRIAACVGQSLDRIRPICKMITQKIEKADRTPKEELDEEQLVSEVKPLIEEGGRILTEANGVIRGLDPDGRIQANAKHKTATRDASPEEYQLADILKELTGTVTECIDGAKKKIEDMPHAKKELSPMWGLLTEPLFQILAAVGLLLNGVLGLVGRLLSGLGLGGLVDSLLGGLGLNRLLEGLGVGGLTDALRGGKKKDKKK